MPYTAGRIASRCPWVTSGAAADAAAAITDDTPGTTSTGKCGYSC